jgi:hypothetical protein
MKLKVSHKAIFVIIIGLALMVGGPYLWSHEMSRVREHGVTTTGQVVSVRIRRNSSSEKKGASTTFRFTDQAGGSHETTFYNYESYGPAELVYDPDNPGNVVLKWRVDGWNAPTWQPWGLLLLGAGCAILGALWWIAGEDISVILENFT